MVHAGALSTVVTEVAVYSEYDTCICECSTTRTNITQGVTQGVIQKVPWGLQPSACPPEQHGKAI